MYVGEGEALLRNTFQRARLAAPSILFFDEADVIAARRLLYYLSSSDGLLEISVNLLHFQYPIYTEPGVSTIHDFTFFSTSRS